MADLKQNTIREKIFFALILAFNLSYIASCFFSPSSFLLIGSFASEAAYLFYYRQRKTFVSIYRDCSPLLSLCKAILFCMGRGNFFLILAFLTLEVYMLAFFRAGYYFKYLASSLPCLNFKNFGLLNKLYVFNKQLANYQNALYVRPTVYLSIIILLVSLPAVYSYPGISFLFLAATVFIGKLIFDSIKYARYIKSGTYRKNLADHAAYHSPEIVVYVSGAPGSSYQLAQWIPVLERLEQRVTVIAREKFWITDLKDSPLHTVFARGMADIESFLTPDTRICLYPANAFKNTQIMRRAELKHIFINHGESDKIVNVSRLISAYSKLYLAGPMAKNRLEAAGISISEDQYAYVGRPQTSIFLKSSSNHTGNILYAPTWEGFDAMSNYNSVGTLALGIIKRIVEQTDYNILFKPHPLTGTVEGDLRITLSRIDSYLQQTGRGSYIKQGDILEFMNQCDIMITDISSVMNDFLETKKPYIVTNPFLIPSADFKKQFQTVQGGYILSHAEKITEILVSINETDPKKAERERIRKYSLGDFECSSLEKFQQEIAKDCVITNTAG